MEVVAVIAAAVGALAALGALSFAWLTIHEARLTRQEQTLEQQRRRLEEIGDLLKQIGEMDIMGGRPGLAKLRLAAALNAAHLDLPSCRALVDAGEDSPTVKLAGAALAEVANALRDLDPRPHARTVRFAED